MGSMDKSKTFFGIYVYEDEKGNLRIQADHYGPGMNSYTLGMELLGRVLECELHNPEKVKVEPLAYLPRPQ
jgi:hypothetical protein